MRYLKTYKLFESIDNVQYITWSEFKENPLFYDELTKAYFSYDSAEDEEEYGVSDINQFGVDGGSYFCTTDNCIEHYRENPGYFDEDDFIIDDDAIIAVSEDEFIMDDEETKNEIMSKADGFYCYPYDTYGLVIWNKSKVRIK